MPKKRQSPLLRSLEEASGKRPSTSLEDLLADLDRPEDERDLDDADAIDKLLAGDIARARRRDAPPDPVELLEGAAFDGADSVLAATDRKPVSYARHSEDPLVMEQAISDELLDPGTDVDIYIREPTDYAKARLPVIPEERQRERQREATRAEFQWSPMKTLAAGFAMLGLPALRIATLIGADPEDVAVWFRSPFFRRRIQKLRDNNGRLAYEFLAGHQLLIGRHLMAIALSGGKEHDTQLRAIKLYLDKMEFTASKFVKNDEVERNPQLAGILNVLEAESRVLDDGMRIEDEWTEREIGPDIIVATADAKRALEYDNAKLLSRPPPTPEQTAEESLIAAFSAPPEPPPEAPRRPAPRRTATDLLRERLDALPAPDDALLDKLTGFVDAPEWTLPDVADLMTTDDLAALGITDPDAPADFADLARLRLESGERDALLDQFFINSLKGKLWQPILGLDPVRRARVTAWKKKTDYRRSRARAAARSG